MIFLLIVNYLAYTKNIKSEKIIFLCYNYYLMLGNGNNVIKFRVFNI
ncbi:MAG: hypothetical protein L6U99_07595 [Clostridium sp.]|nr:MAG: hypothetical protein L6U99_07595 [Clostridium sp.]